MNSMQLPLMANFFMNYFTRPEAMAPQPPRPATGTHTPEYLDQFLIVLDAIFTTGFAFVR